jgi:hypothetical protein
MITSLSFSKNQSLPCADTVPNLIVVPVKFELKIFGGCVTGAVWLVPNADVPNPSKNKTAIIKSFILLFISYL